MSFIKNLFNKKSKDQEKIVDVTKAESIKESDASGIELSVVYNTPHNLVLLYTFTSDYLYDCLQFVSSIRFKEHIGIEYLVKSAEFAIDEDNKDEFGKSGSIKTNCNSYYLLLSCKPKLYFAFYDKVDLDNPFLKRLTRILYQTIKYNSKDDTTITRLINDYIIDKNELVSTNKLAYDGVIVYNEALSVDNVEIAFTRIPNVFTGYELTRFFWLKIYSDMWSRMDKIGTSYNDKITAFADTDTIYRMVFKGLIKNPGVWIKETQYLTKPRYLLSDDEEEFIIPDKSPAELDSIFNTSRSNFRGINGEFEYGDEWVDPLDETENMRETDIISDTEDE